MRGLAQSSEPLFELRIKAKRQSVLLSRQLSYDREQQFMRIADAIPFWRGQRVEI